MGSRACGCWHAGMSTCTRHTRYSTAQARAHKGELLTLQKFALLDAKLGPQHRNLGRSHSEPLVWIRPQQKQVGSPVLPTQNGSYICTAPTWIRGLSWGLQHAIRCLHRGPLPLSGRASSCTCWTARTCRPDRAPSG